MHHKNDLQTCVPKHSYIVSSAASRHSAVRCDRMPVPSADCMGTAVCGLRICGRRSAVIVGFADWHQTDFLFRGRDVVLTINSVKILHAVRSAITATAELLVYIYVVDEDAPLAEEAVVWTLVIRIKRSCPYQTSTIYMTLLRRLHTVQACFCRPHQPASSNIVNSSARSRRQSTFQCR